MRSVRISVIIWKISRRSTNIAINKMMEWHLQQPRERQCSHTVKKKVGPFSMFTQTCAIRWNLSASSFAMRWKCLVWKCQCWQRLRKSPLIRKSFARGEEPYCKKRFLNTREDDNQNTVLILFLVFEIRKTSKIIIRRVSESFFASH